MHFLEHGKRLTPKLRRQMVRIVVTEMMEKCRHVGKRHSTDVAKEMVAKYPKSLQDVKKVYCTLLQGDFHCGYAVHIVA